MRQRKSFVAAQSLARAGVSRRSPAEHRAPSTAAPRPLASARLLRGPAALNSPRPPQPRVPPRPVSSLPVVGAIGATLAGAGPRAWRSAWPRRRRPVRGAGAWRARGEEPVAWGGAGGGLPSGFARCRPSVRCARPLRVRDESPSPDDFPKLLLFPLFYFVVGAGGRGGGGGRPRLIDGPRARFANFQLRLGGRWEGSVPEPEAADLGALRGRRRLGRADSCFALSHPRSSAHTLFVRVQSGRSRGFGFFFFPVYEIFSFFPSPSPEKKVLFCLQWWALTSRSSGGGGGELVGWRSGVLAAEACRRGSELSRRSQAPFPP